MAGALSVLKRMGVVDDEETIAFYNGSGNLGLDIYFPDSI